MNSTEILCQFHGVLSFQCTATSLNNSLLNREAHLTELVTGFAKTLKLSLGHALHLTETRVISATRVSRIALITTSGSAACERSSGGGVNTSGVINITTGGHCVVQKTGVSHVRLTGGIYVTGSLTGNVGVVNVSRVADSVRTSSRVVTTTIRSRISKVIVTLSALIRSVKRGGPTVTGADITLSTIAVDGTVVPSASGRVVGSRLVSLVNRNELTLIVQMCFLITLVLKGVSAVGEGRIGFIEECFVRTVRTVILGTHREDHAGRTGHGLNAADVIGDQVRHGASDQGDQNGVEASARALVGVKGTIDTAVDRTTSQALVTSGVNRHGGGLSQESGRAAHCGLLVKEFLLVLQELCGHRSSVRISNLRKILMIQNRGPLFYKMVRH